MPPSEQIDIKIYRAFPGFTGWIVSLPWFIPLLLVFYIIGRQLTASDYDRVVLLLAMVTLILALIPLVIVGGMVTWTSLRLDLEGIEHQNISIQQSGSYLFPYSLKPRQIRVSWDEIYDISWLEDMRIVGFTPKVTVNGLSTSPTTEGANRPIVISTKAGDITFGVMFNSRVNIKIMQEILSKAPNLKRVRG